MKKLLISLALLSAGYVPAMAQPNPILSGGGCTANCTFTGATVTSGITDTGGVNTTSPMGHNGNVTIDNSASNPFASNPANSTTAYRPNFKQVTLTPSVDTHNTWENDNSWVIFNGPGAALGEINVKHAFFQLSAGTSASAVETMESSANLAGTMGQFDAFLGVVNNQPGGTSSFLTGYTASLNQTNTTAGSVATWQTFWCQPMSGGGAVPTNNFCLRNTDATASINTMGGVNIGTLGQSAPAGGLYVAGPDILGSTFPVQIKNSAGNNLMYIADNGTVAFPKVTTVAGPACLLASGQLVANGCNINVTRNNASATLVAGLSGTHYDNGAASGAIVYTLPAAAAGVNFCFSVYVAQQVEVLAAGSDQIAIGASVTTAGNITSSTNYSNVCIEAHAAGMWVASASTGTWVTH